MSERLFYFVRHGESELNAKRLRHGREGDLTDKGKKQANSVGLRLKTIPIDTIISSPYPRAAETAGIIARQISKPVQFSDLFVERKNPSEIVGKWDGDLEVRKIVDFIDKSFHRNDIRYSDEENFEDLKKRASEALTFLEHREEKSTLVVTHSIFMVMLISYMLSRDNLTSAELVKRGFFNPIANTGITLCSYNKRYSNNETHGWKLISWNDDPYVQYPMRAVEE